MWTEERRRYIVKCKDLPSQELSRKYVFYEKVTVNGSDVIHFLPFLIILLLIILRCIIFPNKIGLKITTTFLNTLLYIENIL